MPPTMFHRASCGRFWLSGLFGWVMISALLLAAPDVAAGATKGGEAVPWILRSTLGNVGDDVAVRDCAGAIPLRSGGHDLGIADDVRLCAGRGLPGSRWLRRVNPKSAIPPSRFGPPREPGSRSPCWSPTPPSPPFARCSSTSVTSCRWRQGFWAQQDLDAVWSVAAGHLVSSAGGGWGRSWLPVPVGHRDPAAE